MNEVGNDQKYLRVEYQVLSGLDSSDSALGFNELQEKTTVSSRTLAKHLKNLVPKNVQKDGKKYRITDAGRKLVEDIKQDPKVWKKGGHQSHVEMVEVYSIDRNHFCRGTVKVKFNRKLLPKERKKLDKAITHTIRTFSSIIPEESRNWRFSIYSHIRSKL
ncbi:DUF7347 domain-containing protein [[Eubacterium] cellulosolvens]